MKVAIVSAISKKHGYHSADIRATMRFLLSIAYCHALQSNQSDAMQCSIHFNEDILHAMQAIQYNEHPSRWNALHHDNA